MNMKNTVTDDNFIIVFAKYFVLNFIAFSVNPSFIIYITIPNINVIIDSSMSSPFSKVEKTEIINTVSAI